MNAALQRKPDDGTALYLLSQACVRAPRRLQEWRSGGNAGGEGGSRKWGAHFWLAECKRHLGDAANAEAEYKQYLQ